MTSRDCFYLLLGWLIAIGLMFLLSLRNRKPPVNPGAVWMRCRDCGREHAVYPDGKVHAVKTEEEVAKLDALTREADKRWRRPGIKD